MPSFANESDKITARVIERWKLTASDEVDDVGAWRDADPSDRIHIYWPQRWTDRGTVHKETMPGMFFGDTTYLVGRIENDYRHLDPAPLMELYEAIAAWHADRTADRVPPQPVLFSTLERAMMNVLVVETDLQSRLGATCDETEATNRASGGKTAAARIPMTKGQKGLWDALDGHILSAKELASESELDTSEDTVRQWVMNLRAAGYSIDRRTGRGYFRTDAPPQEILRRPE